MNVSATINCEQNYIILFGYREYLASFILIFYNILHHNITYQTKAISGSLKYSINVIVYT